MFGSPESPASKIVIEAVSPDVIVPPIAAVCVPLGLRPTTSVSVAPLLRDGMSEVTFGEREFSVRMLLPLE